MIFVDDSLVPVLEPLAAELRDTSSTSSSSATATPARCPNVLRYEELLAAEDGGLRLARARRAPGRRPLLHERHDRQPEGRRSTRTARRPALAGDLHGGRRSAISSSDRVLPVVPMFHANAWGLPYAARWSGADLVMPGRFLQAEPLAKLIESERVTFAGGVPTIWLDMLRYADEHELDLSACARSSAAARPCRESLMRGFQERHGVRIVQAWGMTETSPLGAVAHPPAGPSRARTSGRTAPRPGRLAAAGRGAADRRRRRRGRRGTARRPARSRCAARGSRATTTRTRRRRRSSTTAGCAPATSARSTRSGFVQITDRAKDVIKSGGEWISSVELENDADGAPGRARGGGDRACPTSAGPSARWPASCCEDGVDATPRSCASTSTTAVAKWWLPDEFAFIDEVPKTSVGKFDKKVLRARLAEGELK